MWGRGVGRRRRVQGRVEGGEFNKLIVIDKMEGVGVRIAGMRSGQGGYKGE